VTWKKIKTILYWKTKNKKQKYIVVSMFFSIETILKLYHELFSLLLELLNVLIMIILFSHLQNSFKDFFKFPP
jgi:hypothetical protein